MLQYQRSRKVSCDIVDCGGTTPQMCNRVTNHHRNHEELEIWVLFPNLNSPKITQILTQIIII